MKRTTFKEWLSTYIAKKPRTMVLLGILFFNLLFVLIAAIVIAYLSPDALEGKGIGASLFYTIAMLLDAGSIHNVVVDIGRTNTVVIIVCLFVMIVGTLSFTAAVIGYVTNYISNFIENVHSGKRKLRISNHTIIVNWNSHATEIINELLYSEKKEKVVVLVDEDVEPIKRLIRDRIEDSLEQERKELIKECSELGVIETIKHRRRYKVKNRLSVIVRNGRSFSAKQLSDISVKKAKAIIILSKDVYQRTNKCSYIDNPNKYDDGNTDTIKSLVQVADKAGKDNSIDNQKIIVEINDDWTMRFAEKVIRHKKSEEKSSIVPVPVNKVLGEILAQFSIMPELNKVYDVLLSNKDAEFFCKKIKKDEKTENELIQEYYYKHRHALPVAVMDLNREKDDDADSKKKVERYMYFVTDREKDIDKTDCVNKPNISVKINDNFCLEKRNIIILGHNSKSSYILDAFASFRNEWNYIDGSEILNIRIVDDKNHIQEIKERKDENEENKYTFINDYVEAEIHEEKKIEGTIKDFIYEHKNEDVSILILSDDNVKKDELDTNALTFLIYVKDVLKDIEDDKKNKFKGKINITVEIINHKNFDVVQHYGVENVVISNKYISKMMTQIGEKDALYELYVDMLTYDEPGVDMYTSKELSIKKASVFFEELPEEAKPDVLARSVFEASPDNNKAMVLGYVDKDGNAKIFAGPELKKKVKLSKEDKIIVYNNH